MLGHEPRSSLFVGTPEGTVGTIHSVKRGQADVVYLFPDLNRAGLATYERPGRDRDSILRLFYVSATRAREMLYICQSEMSTACFYVVGSKALE